MEQRINDLFASIDRSDATAFAGHLSDDVRLQFGNAPAVSGRDTVRDVIAGFFASIKGLRHTVERTWVEADAVICHGSVTYTRHDGSHLTVPFANVLGLRNDEITDYRIYVDTSALYTGADMAS